MRFLSSIRNKGNLVLVYFFLSFIVHAQDEKPLIAPLFKNGMVLQRDMEISIWGWSRPGETVNMSFNGSEKSTHVKENGYWSISLPAMEASSTGKNMMVIVGKDTIDIEDVVIGEVWLCSGQSNMAMRMIDVSRPPKDSVFLPLAEQVTHEILTAEDPLLRMIEVPKRTSYREEMLNFEGKWKSVHPEATARFSAVAYYFAKELREKLDIPIGLIYAPWGGTRVEPWIPPKAFENEPALAQYYDQEINSLNKQIKLWDPDKNQKNYEERMVKWENNRKLALDKKETIPRKPRLPIHPELRITVPGTLYNGMIASLVPFTMRGVIWYQGEGNRGHHPELYAEHFRHLISYWRKAWGQENLFFFWCQLASFQNPVDEPVENDNWAMVSYQQSLVLDLPNTGMAVLNDIGEYNDIHPHNKMDVGKRLSILALDKAYEMDILSSGPVLRSYRFKKRKVFLSFDHTGDGLMTGRKELDKKVVELTESPKHFQIKSKRGTWKWAEVRIIGKDQVEVYHPEIRRPYEIRYAWAANPEKANLYNSEGLPVGLFVVKKRNP